MEKMENEIINEKQKKAVKIIKNLLDEMHKDIQQLMKFETLDKGTEKIKSKSLRIAKIATADTVARVASGSAAVRSS